MANVNKCASLKAWPPTMRKQVVTRPKIDLGVLTIGLAPRMGRTVVTVAFPNRFSFHGSLQAAEAAEPAGPGALTAAVTTGRGELWSWAFGIGQFGFRFGLRRKAICERVSTISVQQRLGFGRLLKLEVLTVF